MLGNVLGPFISRNRKELGLSLRAMAEKAQISPSQLSKIENGSAKSPNDETLERIAYALNVDKDRLFALAGKLSKDSVNDAARYIPAFLGDLAVRETAATYEPGYTPVNKPDYLSDLEGYAFGREEFVAKIWEVVREQWPEAPRPVIEKLVLEMVAAHDLTVRRHARKPDAPQG
ncbi:helix-turn-helix domain-containing protein [Paenibacillus sp. FSL R7-0128]|uniref:helix-turn-helix domain-containing protein n=1 Tax=Paenibacillus sp. FSL R7-0128 TaxID=2954529 RepID=UPI0030FC1826